MREQLRKIYRVLCVLVYRLRHSRRSLQANSPTPAPLLSETPGHLRFTCNICGTEVSAALETIHDREAVSCPCGSTLRFRSVVAALSERLLGTDNVAMQSALPQKDIVGLGMSDCFVYATLLEKKFSYTNTYYHAQPHLDISNPPADLLGKHNFVVTSDVMEHVAPPIVDSFRNLHRLLKPKGVLVLTVPCTNTGDTREHYPELFDYKIVGEGPARQLINTTQDGREQVFDNLVFHGGDGATLEMRLFSESGLIDTLKKAGFTDIKIHDQSLPQFGIVHKHKFSLPVTAVRES